MLVETRFLGWLGVEAMGLIHPQLPKISHSPLLKNGNLLIKDSDMCCHACLCKCFELRYSSTRYQF